VLAPCVLPFARIAPNERHKSPESVGDRDGSEGAAAPTATFGDHAALNPALQARRKRRNGDAQAWRMRVNEV